MGLLDPQVQAKFAPGYEFKEEAPMTNKVNADEGDDLFQDAMTDAEFNRRFGGMTREEVRDRNLRAARKRDVEIKRTAGRGDGGFGYENLAPDKADIALRDFSGRAGRGRGGSSKSALGLARSFDPSKPFGYDSLMGD